MKKMLKRVFALMCIVTLFAAPATALASSIPVLVNDNGYSKFFEYQPNPYPVTPNSQLAFNNNVIDGGWWIVPSGNTFALGANFDGHGVLEYRVYRKILPSPYADLVAVGDSWNGALFFEIPAIDEAALYFVHVVNNTSTTVYVRNYFAYYQ